MVTLLLYNSRLMMVKDLDLLCICLAETSLLGKLPSSMNVMMGCAHVGTGQVPSSGSSISIASTDITTSYMGRQFPESSQRIPEFFQAAFQFSNYVLESDKTHATSMGVPGSCGAVPGSRGLLPTSTSIGTTSGSGLPGMNIESDSDEGLIDGL